MKRRDFIRLLAAAASRTIQSGQASEPFQTRNPQSLSQAHSPNPNGFLPTRDYHGFLLQPLLVDGCKSLVVKPHKALPGRPWVWRTMFWDAYPGVDIALLQAGFHVAFMDVGNTFGSPDAMKHFDVFYDFAVETFGLALKPALEGLSRGGLYAYRWAYVNTDKVGCIYCDAPVCDMKSWPGGKGTGVGSPKDLQAAIESYHFADEKELLEFTGNPVDILGPIAAARIPILSVCGDADKTVPLNENSEIVRERYIRLGGSFALIVKQGCEHHPHGLKDPAPIANFIMAHCAKGRAATRAATVAPRPGAVTVLPPGQW